VLTSHRRFLDVSHNCGVSWNLHSGETACVATASPPCRLLEGFSYACLSERNDFLCVKVYPFVSAMSMVAGVALKPCWRTLQFGVKCPRSALGCCKGTTHVISKAGCFAGQKSRSILQPVSFHVPDIGPLTVAGFSSRK
jgi:hypothetical protein